MKLLPLLFAFFAVLSIADSPSARAEAPDPYNTLIWKKGDAGDWYEWWYYKVVDPTSGEAFYFTYGVLNPGRVNGFGFLQAGSYGDHAALDARFALSDFSASTRGTQVALGRNTATDQRITGSLGDLSWDLAYTKDWGFAAMGWAMEHPSISNIFWYPAQASAFATGTITYRGRTIHLEHAPAYQDRNWGRSFPDWWTWLVSNHFENSPGTVLAAGGGKPRLFNGPAISGLCIGLRYGGVDHAWRTNDGDSISFDIKWGKWEVTATNGAGDKIEISAFAPAAKFLLLPFPTPQGKSFYDYEALAGAMTVKLARRKGFGWENVATLSTQEAGIEWGSPDPVSLDSLFGSELVHFQ
jgi:tocopherol cyclase